MRKIGSWKHPLSQHRKPDADSVLKRLVAFIIFDKPDRVTAPKWLELEPKKTTVDMFYDSCLRFVPSIGIARMCSFLKMKTRAFSTQ